jgi:guanylate kinase
MAAAHVSRFRPIVLCGPSGAGKSTLISRLRAEFPSAFGFSVSHTTRAPRAGEEDGVAYHFSTRDVMEPAIAAGEFLESADVHGNLYGTSFAAIRSVAEQGRACILDIDVQGVRSCRRAGFDVGAYIFISTPSVADLEARLRGRATESEEKILKRVAAASGEITGAASMWWDAWIVNDELEVRRRGAWGGASALAGAAIGLSCTHRLRDLPPPLFIPIANRERTNNLSARSERTGCWKEQRRVLRRDGAQPGCWKWRPLEARARRRARTAGSSE